MGMPGTRSSSVAAWISVLALVLFAAYWGIEEMEDPERPGVEASDDFASWVREELDSRTWRFFPVYRPRLTRRVLEESLALGTDFIINNQLPEGNFHYEYDWITGEQNPSDNQVRQAGALWGIALIHQDRPAERTRAALESGLEFFYRHAQDGPGGSLLVAYPRERRCSTGTVALVAMAIVEYLRSGDEIAPERRAELDGRLDRYLAFLVSQQMDNGHFSSSYTLRTGQRRTRSSPYYDGETLLCLIKAAKYLGKTHLLPVIQRAARAMAQTYTREAWREDADSDRTKGFYQWGSMSFWEYQDAGWPDGELYADLTLMLAHWMVRTHRTLSRSRNTAYAMEGLSHAYQIAQSRRDRRAASELRQVIDKALYKLMTWQVGGPLAAENRLLRENPTNDPLALGGFMNHRRRAPLRIDVTQHQTHAMILALRYVFTE